MKKCKSCGHSKENHTDKETKELGGCLYISNKHYGESQGEDYCPCEEYK